MTKTAILAKLHEELPPPTEQQNSGRRTMQPAWLAIGDALAQLEDLSVRSENGRSWLEFLLEDLAAQGHQITAGHIHKLKRVRNFVRRYPGKRQLTDTDIYKAQISALEIAERLHRLDADAGWKMFEECLNGLSFADAKRQYDKFQDEHQDVLPPRQAAWLKKRKFDHEETDADGPKHDVSRAVQALHPKQHSKSDKDLSLISVASTHRTKPATAPSPSGISDEISQQMSELLDRAWQDGRATAFRETQQTIANRDARIKELLEEVALYKEEAEELEVQMQITVKKYRECMGDDHEVD
jgi:hypothetical protein